MFIQLGEERQRKGNYLIKKKKKKNKEERKQEYGRKRAPLHVPSDEKSPAPITTRSLRINTF